MSVDHALSKSIDELELSIRSHNLLMNLEVETIGDLVRLTETDVLTAAHSNRMVLGGPDVRGHRASFEAAPLSDQPRGSFLVFRRMGR